MSAHMADRTYENTSKPVELSANDTTQHDYAVLANTHLPMSHSVTSTSGNGLEKWLKVTWFAICCCILLSAAAMAISFISFYKISQGRYSGHRLVVSDH